MAVLGEIGVVASRFDVVVARVGSDVARLKEVLARVLGCSRSIPSSARSFERPLQRLCDPNTASPNRIGSLWTVNVLVFLQS